MSILSKQDAISFLADVPDNLVFYCRDGKVFKNLKDLRDGLANINNDVFLHHVNISKNDFARWVLDVIKDNTLASKLSDNNIASSANIAAAIVGNRIIALSRKARST